MVSYPNQKSVYVNRDIPKQTKENKRPYSVIYRDNLESAMQNISKISSLKLYIYLVGNINGYHFALSTQDVSDVCGISLQSAKDAVNDLIEKGYLVLRDKKLYDFYETPHLDDIDFVPIEEKTKVFTNRKTGEQLTLTYEQVIEKFGNVQGDKLWRNAK